MKTVNLKHDSAIKHVTGHSVYVNDMAASRQLVGRVVSKQPGNLYFPPH